MAPNASKVAFRGPDAKFPGLPVAELDEQQKKEVQKVLLKLVEPYRQPDQDEALAALKKQGGFDRCSLVFYWKPTIHGAPPDPKNLPSVREVIDRSKRSSAGYLWQHWRLEGPSFVWHYRGIGHLHAYVNVADDPSVKLNARGY